MTLDEALLKFSPAWYKVYYISHFNSAQLDLSYGKWYIFVHYIKKLLSNKSYLPRITSYWLSKKLTKSKNVMINISFRDEPRIFYGNFKLLLGVLNTKFKPVQLLLKCNFYSHMPSSNIYCLQNTDINIYKVLIPTGEGFYKIVAINKIFFSRS